MWPDLSRDLDLEWDLLRDLVKRPRLVCERERERLDLEQDRCDL